MRNGLMFFSLIHTAFSRCNDLLFLLCWGFTLRSITTVPLGLKRSAELPSVFLYKCTTHTHSNPLWTLCHSVKWLLILLSVNVWWISYWKICIAHYMGFLPAKVWQHWVSGTCCYKDSSGKKYLLVVSTESDVLFVSQGDSQRAHRALIYTSLWNWFLLFLCSSRNMLYCATVCTI